MIEVTWQHKFNTYKVSHLKACETTIQPSNWCLDNFDDSIWTFRREDNIFDGDYCTVSYVFIFDDDADAMAFKLRWL